MRKAAMAAVLLAGCAATGEPAAEVPGDPVPAAADRASLEIPADLWEEAMAGLGRGGRPLGYTAEEMANYGGRRHLLRTVETLFRDARTLPRFSGALAGSLVKEASKPDEVVRIAFGLTDAVAGRMLPLPDAKEGWGVDWIPAEADPDAALEVLLGRAPESMKKLLWGSADAMRGEDRAAWALLPPEVKRLAVRLCVAAADAGPWILAGVGGEGSPLEGNPANGSLLRSSTAPFDHERLGQAATLDARSLAEFGRVDREYLAFGSVLLLARVRQALDEYAAAEKGPVPESFAGCSFLTEAGSAWIRGPGDSEGEMGPALLVLDLGGNDRLHGNVGSPSAGPARIGLAVDLGGDDVYDAGQVGYGVGAGIHGVGAVFDLGGNDVYRCRENGIGCAWFGTGLVFDAAGDDLYETETRRGQGVGFAGVGALIDLAGDDRYVVGHEGQGYGSTLGCGLLLDVSGDDTYLARDDGNVSELYLGRSVSMAQGVGQGRRADLGDGHSLAGGFGVLVDGAGNDSYRAECWAHGAGYWWSVGILEDLGGDDEYRDGKYSLGAAAHFAVGVCVDASGDDDYNVGDDEAVNQYQGHGRDGSLGVFVDGAGDDRYQLRAHCGGSGDLGSAGLFWDRCGDDRYEITAVRQGEGTGWPDTPPLGSATVSERMRSWRDDLDACGLFLDTGGRDAYTGEPGPWGDGLRWRTDRGPRSKGWGTDVGRFLPPAGE